MADRVPPRRAPAAAARHDGPPALGTALLAVAGLVGVGGVALLGVRAEFLGLLVVGCLLAVAGVLAQQPSTADRVLAGVVGILLLPALLAVALAVRLSGPGPVLVRQVRPGSRPVAPLRFRTTGTTPTEGGRVTPVGRLLRELSLDVLPGLLDVVRGDLPLLRTRSR